MVFNADAKIESGIDYPSWGMQFTVQLEKRGIGNGKEERNDKSSVQVTSLPKI